MNPPQQKQLPLAKLVESMRTRWKWIALRGSTTCSNKQRSSPISWLVRGTRPPPLLLSANQVGQRKQRIANRLYLASKWM